MQKILPGYFIVQWVQRPCGPRLTENTRRNPLKKRGEFASLNLNEALNVECSRI